MKKTCTKCKKEKDRNDFKRDIQSSENRRSQCKECDNKACQERRDKIKLFKIYDL